MAPCAKFEQSDAPDRRGIPKYSDKMSGRHKHLAEVGAEY